MKKTLYIIFLVIIILSINIEAQAQSNFDSIFNRETEGFFVHKDAKITKNSNSRPENKDGFIESNIEAQLDGVWTAKVIIGKRPDFSILFRAAFPGDLAEVSGYSVSMDGLHLQIHRWEEGYAEPVTDRIKLKKRPETLDFRIVMSGAHVAVTATDEKQKIVAELEMVDASQRGFQGGWRVYKKQDAETALVSLAFEAAKTQTDAKDLPDINDPDAYIRQHPRVFIIRPQNDPDKDKLAVLKKKCSRIKNGLIPDYEVYRCSHAVMMTLVDEQRHLPENWYWSEPRHSYADGEYREAARDLKCRVPMRCDKNQPLDPNRSAKDVAMIQAYLDGYAEICKKNVKYVRLETIGKTWMGHDIRALVLTDVPPDTPHPRVLFNGAHHGMELLSTDFAFDVLEYICEKTEPGDYIHYHTLHHAEVWVVPAVNLDGVDLFFHVSDHLGRKNGRGVFQDISNERPWPAKYGAVSNNEGYYRYRPNRIDVGAGVDVNRNYPLNFGATGEISSSARRRAYWYRGTGPASEPEIQSMMNLFHVVQFTGSISFHTVSTRILSPYSIDALQNPPHEEDPLWQLAEKMAFQAGEQANGRNYEVVKNIYSVDGTDQDWFRMVSGTWAYLIEGAMHNPTGENRRLAIEKNRPAWMTFLKDIYSGSIVRVRDTEGNPLIAEITYSSEAHLNNEHWLTRCSDGTHSLPIPRKTQVTATLYDGSSQTQTATWPVTDFTFDRPADYSLEKAACSSGLCETMMSVDALCDMRRGRCPSLPAQRYCLIEDICVQAGFTFMTGVFGTWSCDPRENNRGWTVRGK